MLASMLDNTNLVKRNFHWKQSLFIKATKLLPSNMVGWNSCCTKSLHSIVVDESTVPERWKTFLNILIRAQNIPKIKALTETWSRLIRPLSLSLKEKEDLFYWHAELQISYIWQTILIVKSSQQRSDCWTSVLDENSVGVEGPEGEWVNLRRSAGMVLPVFTVLRHYYISPCVLYLSDFQPFDMNKPFNIHFNVHF